VFVRSGTNWTQQTELAGVTPNGSFGWAVGISGTTVVVGAQGNEAGAAYVYTQSGTTWPLQQELTPSNGAANDFFGDAASISENTVVMDDTANN